MLPKPDICRACPGYAWDNGQGFMAFEGPPKNGVVLCGEAGGEHEAQLGRPFIGPAGKLLAKTLAWEGLKREEFGIANCLCCHPKDNDITTPEAKAALQICPFLWETLQAWKPKAIVALGATAFHQLTGEALPIGEARGYPFWSAKANCWVIPTYHPAFLARGQQRLSRVLLKDVKRAIEIAEKGLAPHYTNYVLDPTPQEAEAWADGYFAAYATSPATTWLAFDIETPMSAKGVDEGELELDDDPTYTILRIGFAYAPGEALSIPWRGDYLAVIARLLGSPGVKLAHNGRYDCPRVTYNGITIAGPLWDTMNAWHVLNSDLEKGLGFVAPFYVPGQTAWKHLSVAMPAHYNATDADVTVRIAQGLVKDLHAHGLWRVFERHVVELDQLLDRMSQVGMPLDQAGRRTFSLELQAEMTRLDGLIEAAVPLAARQLKVYKRKPEGVEGLQELEIPAVAKVCSVCGKKASKVHPHVKSGEGVILEQAITVPAWGVPLPFKLSTVRLMAYQKVYGHRPVLSRDKERRVTFDEDAMKVLVKRYPKDPLYPLVVDRREVEKLKGTLIGEWVEEEGRFRGGMPTDREGRVHTVYTHRPSTLRLSSVNPNMQNCYDGATQVLTPMGWVYLPDLPVGTAVAQWSVAGIEFVEPSAHIRRLYCGDMLELHSSALDLRVTADHRIISRQRSGVLCVDTATDWLQQPAPPKVIDRKFIRGGRRVGGRTLSSAERLFLRQAVCVQAEGWVKPRQQGIEVAIRSPRKQAQLRELFGDRVRTRGQTGRIKVDVRCDDPCLAWLVLPSKDFKLDALLELSAEELEQFIQEVMRWDGDFTRGRTFQQRQDRQGAVLAVQTAAVLSGYSTSWYQHGKHTCVNIHPQAERWASRVQTTAHHVVDEPVYCVTVPSGMLLVRRHNDVVVCGNCPSGREGEQQARVKKLFVAEPGCVLGEIDYCVSPEVRVLKQDLTWTRADQLQVGDPIIGFDEHVGRGAGQSHCFRRATVERVEIIQRPRVRVVTDRGSIVVSAEHRFMGRFDSYGRKWVQAQALRAGFQLTYLCDPWDVDESRDGGYLAGFFDGEGWLTKTHVGYGQNPGPTLTRVQALLQARGLEFYEAHCNSTASCYVTNMADAMRFIGMVRPARLTPKADVLWEGRRTWGKRTPIVTVIRVEPLPPGPVVAIRTTTGTLITDGYFSHNCAIEAVLVGYFAGSRDYVRLARIGVHDYLSSHILARAKKIPHPAEATWPDDQLYAFLHDLKKRFKPERDVAKRVIHGSAYGMTPARMQTLYPESFPTVRIASDLQRLYFDTFPAIKKWQNRTVEQAAERAYLVNPFGYRHWFWNVKVWKKMGGEWVSEWGEDAKKALAFMPQSTAAAIIKEAMLRIQAAGLAGYLRLQVHDSLVTMLPEKLADVLGRAIFRLMVEPCRELPLDPRWGMGPYLAIGAEAKVGKNWGEMTEVTW